MNDPFLATPISPISVTGAISRERRPRSGRWRTKSKRFTGSTRGARGLSCLLPAQKEGKTAVEGHQRSYEMGIYHGYTIIYTKVAIYKFEKLIIKQAAADEQPTERCQPRGASAENALNSGLVRLGRDLGFPNHVLFSCFFCISKLWSAASPGPEILLSEVLAIIWSVRNFWFHPRLAKVERDGQSHKRKAWYGLVFVSEFKSQDT